MITKADAVLSLVPDAHVMVTEDEIIWRNVDKPPVTDEQINQEYERLLKEYAANEYQRNRASEYPSFADQFDLLYHGGYDVWKAKIDEIKNKYPKPESM